MDVTNVLDGIAGLRAGRMALRTRPGHQHHTTTPKIANPDVVISVNGYTPCRVDRIVARETRRRRLGCRLGESYSTRRWSSWGFSRGPTACDEGELELLHELYPVGDDWRREVQRHVASGPKISLRVQGNAADANSSPEGFDLGRITRPPGKYSM